MFNELLFYDMTVLIIICVGIIVLIIIHSAEKKEKRRRKSRSRPNTNSERQEPDLEWDSQNRQRIYNNKLPEASSQAESSKLHTDSHQRFITQDELAKIAKEYSEIYTTPPSGIDDSVDQFVNVDCNITQEVITEIYFEIKGLYYRDSSAINTAKNLMIGEYLYFSHETNNIADPYAMRILTISNVFIGYVDKNCSKEFYKHRTNFLECVVTRVKNEYNPPYVHICAKYKGALVVCGDNISSLLSRQNDYITPAMNLKIENKLEKAGDSFVYAIKNEPFNKEKSIAYHQACVCYRKAKNYEKEIDVIKMVLQDSSLNLDSKKLFSYQNRLATAKRFKEGFQKKSTQSAKKTSLIIGIIDSIYYHKLEDNHNPEP